MILFNHFHENNNKNSTLKIVNNDIHQNHHQKKDNNIEKTAKNVILATGARSKNLPFVSSDGVNIWDYKTAMTPPKLPSSLIIVGSGAIGIEFASFYNDLGVDVTIVEALPSILPNEDTDISKIVKNPNIPVSFNISKYR